MAAPILQFKRGTTVPGSIFNAAEPVYNISSKILYLGDSGGTGAGAGSAVASAGTYAAASEILVKSVASTSAGQVLLKDAQASQNTLTVKAPATVTASYSFTLPAAVPAAASGYFMTSNTSGDTSWSQVGISVVTGLGTGVATFLGTPSSANLASAVTDETGSGSLVFATSPTLVTPALGTPSSGTLTSCTGLPISTGVSGLGTGVATFLATPSSANLISAVTDETGSGALVFGTSPSLTTPSLAGETFSTTNNVTAGTNAQGQGALTTDINVITTAAAAPSGVTLPTATTGRRLLIVNKGANAVNVYPATGATIDALAVNTAISIPVNGLLEFNASSTTQWYSSFNSSVTGTGVTTFSGGTTGLTPNSATTGAITLGGTLAVANGGTGVTTSTGSGSVVLSTSPSLTTPALGTPSSGTLTSCTGLPISTGVSGLGTNVSTFLATPSSANLASAVTDETGSGALVFATSPTLVTPALGTPSSGTLTSCTGLPVSTGISGLGTGVATFLATPTSANLISAVSDETGTGALVFATSPTLVTPALGTPSSGTLTSCTGLPISTGVSGLAANVAAFLATPSSANLATMLTDETGTGANVFGTSPTITTSLVAGSASFDLLNATATTVNFAGAATTLTVGNTATAAQTVDMFTASTGASTYNIATGATATATTKSINIGTNGVAGSTTNINIGGSAGTSTTTVNGNLTVGGNLTISGNTTILNTQTIQVEDRFIELGLVGGTAPSSATTWDTAIGFNYFATTAKKSGIVWLDNSGFALASELAIGSGDTGTTAADPQLTVTTHATLAVGNLYVGALATATNEVINSSKQVINVTIDCGTY
jgi:hypothetical protein